MKALRFNHKRTLQALRLSRIKALCTNNTKILRTNTLRYFIKTSSSLVALLAISSLLNLANALNFISSAAVAGGGKLVANGVDIGWLHFTQGAPIAASFGGQNRIRYLSVDTDVTVDIILVGLDGNELMIDDFDRGSKGRVNIITNIPSKVYVNSDYAQGRITINGRPAAGAYGKISGQDQNIISKAYTGMGTYKMENPKLTIKEIVASSNRDDENFFNIDTSGIKNADIDIPEQYWKYVKVDGILYAEWKKLQQVSNKNSSTDNNDSQTNTATNVSNNAITLSSAFKGSIPFNDFSLINETNTMLIYNMLHNYEGTYLAYDYGLANTISVGAFQNGFFARYYTKRKWNELGNEYGYDVGLKLRSKWTKANLYYSDYYQKSIVATLGLKKDFGFNLSENLSLFITPAVNANYAYTLKKDSIPTNHLGFFNAELEAGIKIWHTTVLAKASAGRAYNSLKSVSLYDGAFSYEPDFIKNVYSLGVGVSQKLFGRLYISADAGYVYLDKKFWEKSQLKSGVFKAGVMLSYHFKSNKLDNIMGYYDEESTYIKRDKYGREVRKSKVSKRY